MKNLLRYHLTSLLALAMLAGFAAPVATTDSTAKLKGYLSLKYVNEDGKGRVYLKLLTDEGRVKVPMQNTIVNVFLNEESKLGMLGNILTNEDGEGNVPIWVGKFPMFTDTVSEFDFIGSSNNDPRLSVTQKLVHVKKTTLELSLFEKDSARYAKAVLKERNADGDWVPVPGVDVVFNVKKKFCLLPTVTTDETGEARLQLPEGLEGDEAGNMKITAKADVKANNITVIASAEQKWGNAEAVSTGKGKYLSTALIVGFWLIIVYLVTQLITRIVAQKRKD